MRDLLGRLLNVEESEATTVGLLWCQSFCIGMAIVSYETAATSLFLGAFSAGSLPYVYIGISVVGVILGLGYLRLEANLEPANLFKTTVGLILTGMVGIRVLLAFSSAKAAFLAAMIWVDVTVVFVGLQFWSLAGMMMTVRQGKRLFGVIGSGEVAGVVLGGLTLPLVVSAVGTYNLMIVSSAFMIGCFWLLSLSTGRIRDDLGDLDSESNEEFGIGDMLRMPYLRLLFAFVFLVVLSDYFVDFFFYSAVEQRFPEQEELAAFLGPFFAIGGAGAFLAKVFVFNRVMMRFGTKGGMLTLPLAMTMAIGGALLAGAVFPQAVVGGVTWVFGFILLAKLLDLGLRPSVLEPTHALMFQPIPSAQQLRVVSFNDTVVKPVCHGLTGLLLLGLTAGLGWGGTNVAWCTLGIMIVWMVCSLLVQKGYAEKLIDTFGKRRLFAGTGRTEVDRATLLPCLDSDEPGSVIYSLRILAASNTGADTHPELEAALDHPSSDVRIEALQLLKEHGAETLAPRLERMFNEFDIEGPVLAAAVDTYCALLEGEAVNVVYPFLHHGDEQVMRTAVVGLIRYGGITGVLTAGQTLNEFLNAEDRRKRSLAARILEGIAITSFYQPLVQLLRDTEVEVRRDALKAAAVLRNHKLVDQLVDHATDPETEMDARRALVSFGAVAVPALVSRFEALSMEAPERIGIAKVLGRINEVESAKVLAGSLAESGPKQREVICWGLANINYRAEGEMRRTIEVLIKADLKLMNQLQEEEAFCGEWALVQRSLAAEKLSSIHRVFDLLRVFSQSEGLALARTRFLMGGEFQQSLALELMDNLLRGEMRVKVLAAFEKFTRAKAASRDREEVLPILLKRAAGETSAFLKAALIWAFWERAPKAMSRLIELVEGTTDPLLRETVRFCIAAEPTMDRNDLMIRKTELLSQISIFADTRIHELVDLAQVLHPRTEVAGTPLIIEGNQGGSLFVVVEGRVRVHKEHKTLTTLGPGTVLGELAALEPQKRTSSVTMLEDGVVVELGGTSCGRTWPGNRRLRTGYFDICAPGFGRHPA